MKKTDLRLAFSVLWLIIGLALIALSVTDVLTDPVYSGMGGALTAVGALQLLRQLRYRRDPEYREKVETTENDERNQFLALKSWRIAGTAGIVVLGVASLVAAFIGERTVQLTLSYSVCLLVCIYWVSYVLLSRKY